MTILWELEEVEASFGQQMGGIFVSASQSYDRGLQAEQDRAMILLPVRRAECRRPLAGDFKL